MGLLPPLVGVAVFVADVPAHTGFALADMLTLTGCLGFTVIVTGVLVAGFPVAHVALLVNLHLTTSLFWGTVFVNVGLLFIGTSVSLTYHE